MGGGGGGTKDDVNGCGDGGGGGGGGSNDPPPTVAFYSGRAAGVSVSNKFGRSSKNMRTSSSCTLLKYSHAQETSRLCISNAISLSILDVG